MMMKVKLPILPLPLAAAAAATSRRLFSAAATAIETAETSSAAAAAAAAEMREKKPTEPLYRRLSALGGAPEGSISKAMNKWVREGRSVKSIQLIKFVKDLRKYKRHRHALELMDWMVKIKGMNMSYTNHAIRLDLISKVRGIEAAEDYFSKLPDPAKNERTYGALFKCYCSEKMADKADTLFKKMKELNFASRTLVHKNLMALYMKLEQPEKVPLLLLDMMANNISPDNHTYCIVMNSYAAMKDINSVERIIHEMEETEEVIVQWPAYSTLASIYISAGFNEKAESALKKLEELIDSRDREPFHFLISLYASAGNLSEVKRAWNLLKSTFLKQTNMSYLTMLQALNKMDDIEGLKNLYEEWKSVYVSYDVRLTNILSSAYLRKNMVEEAESLFQEAKIEERGFDFRTCDLFIDYYLKENDINSAFKWLEVASQMVKESEWKMEDEKVSLFLKHYEKAKDVDGMEKYYDILKKINSLSPKVYESLIRTYIAAGKKNNKLGKRIEKDEIELDHKTQKMLERVCASN